MSLKIRERAADSKRFKIVIENDWVVVNTIANDFSMIVDPYNDFAIITAISVPKRESLLTKALEFARKNVIVSKQPA